MKTVSLAGLAPIVIALLAGCGSSKNATATSASTTSSSTQGSYAASATSTAPSPTATALITTKQSKLGTILAAGSERLTVYLFEGDKGRASSSCTGACAAAWPPVTGQPRAGGRAAASELGTTIRPDGTTQVTYKGHPLYLFAEDKDRGDNYGQGIKSFGADWYVLSPSGSKVDQS